VAVEREERWEEGTRAPARKGALKQRRVGPIRCGPEHADRQTGPSGSDRVRCYREVTGGATYLAKSNSNSNSISLIFFYSLSAFS